MKTGLSRYGIVVRLAGGEVPRTPEPRASARALFRRPQPKGSGAWPAPRLRPRRARVPSAVPRHRPEAEAAAAAEHLPASRAKEAPDRRPARLGAKMAEGSGGGASPGVPMPPPSTLKGLREQMVAAAQALAEERRNQGGVSTVSLQAPISTKAKPVLDGSLLKSEERQRLARERREEREKQHAAKETQILEKEKKAKLQYEKQMEEKQKRLREQKLKEQQRRAAVEQKRKQKIEEEKVHYEAVVHRTLERSQRLDTRQKRWSWSGSVTDSSGKAEAPAVAEVNKRSTSALNLKQPDPALHKRLSSSAALLNSPSIGTAKRSSSLNRLNNKSSLSSEQGLANALQAEQKGEPEKKRSSSLSRVSSKLPEVENVQKEEKACRLVSPLENASVSRLLAPTQASLARSKSAAILSAAEGKDPTASTSFPAHLPKVPLRSRSTDRLKGAACLSENVSSESAQKIEPAKQPQSSSSGKRAPSPSLPSSRRSVSPGNAGKLPPSPATIRRRPPPSSPNVSRQRQSSPMMASKLVPIQRLPLTPNVLGVTKKKSDAESKANNVAPQEQGAAGPPSEKEPPAGPPKTKEDASGKTLPGTTTAEEASKILAEKRRLAREQREREDQEKLQREEEERIQKEQLARIAQEKQAQEEAALQEMEELKRAEEEELQRLAEKDRIQREQEEQEKQAELQLQREEAEARAFEEAERQRQERERIMQQNLQERLERKKRIEEIMKRTRKAEQSEAKNEDKSNEEDDEDVEEDEGVEEDEEQDLEKQDQPEKPKGEDSSLEDGSEALHRWTLLQEGSTMGADDVFINGNKQEEEEERRGDGHPLYFSQLVENSIPAKAKVVENSEILHVNEADRSIGFLPNFNGKPSGWNFEEIIDLGMHPKTARLSSESIAADMPGQNFRDGSQLPGSPKLAFEEDAGVNCLTKSIEAASEL
ncbi:MAP7 domain-containing protein 3 [Crotalus adamanteus]|uniref:MAP7 domain-containing protein 3 n=1 Tax=Crotalus adamanteus TaxID=8729 RepID=A0AAW1AV15_CROAD